MDKTVKYIRKENQHKISNKTLNSIHKYETNVIRVVFTNKNIVTYLLALRVGKMIKESELTK